MGTLDQCCAAARAQRAIKRLSPFCLVWISIGESDKSITRFSSNVVGVFIFEYYLHDMYPTPVTSDKKFFLIRINKTIPCDTSGECKN